MILVAANHFISAHAPREYSAAHYAFKWARLEEWEKYANRVKNKIRVVTNFACGKLGSSEKRQLLACLFFLYRRACNLWRRLASSGGANKGNEGDSIRMICVFLMVRSRIDAITPGLWADLSYLARAACEPMRERLSEEEIYKFAWKEFSRVRQFSLRADGS